MEVILWAPDMNHQHAETWAAFQSLIQKPIRVITWSLLDKTRKDQGWIYKEYEGLKTEVLNKNKWWSEGTTLINKNPDAIHVFVGFWTIRAFYLLFLYALSRGIKTAVLNEPYSISCNGYFREEPFILSWIKVKFRPFLYQFTASIVKFLSRANPPCILPLSLIAKEQFIQAGFQPQSIFPFGYFVSKNYLSSPPKKCDGKLKMVFVGALLKRKGVDVVAQAVETLSKQGIQISLDVYGSGNPDIFISPSSNCVRYKGLIPQGQAQKVIAQYDLLILSSRHDGWGLVVNEALLQGVPVILSDRVGAKCLIESSDSGLLFKSEDVGDLAKKIKSLAIDGSRIESLKRNTALVAPNILPGVAAEYLMAVFNYYFFNEGNKPSAIWCGREANDIIQLN
jgi:glycosyltransferase involved in cell wall biosynthesis